MSVRAAAPVRVPELLLALLTCIAGFALSLHLFYPGMATHDALAVYDQAYAGRFGDWQPPLLGVIWIALEQVLGYGPRAIFLPSAALYWLGFLLLFLGLRRSGARVAWLALPVALLPPVFALTGTIWRDVIFSILWLVGFGLVLASADRGRVWRTAALVPAGAIVLTGFLLRPNALFAAAPLLVYLAWPRDWRWRRLLVFALPISAVLVGSTYAVNYLWLKARQDHGLYSIFVFDLAGITHFSGENVFPIAWTPQELETLKAKCYNPAYWDAIWWRGCTFAMHKIDYDVPPGSKLFGSPRLRQAWIEAVLAHPLAYAEHRLNHFRVLLTGELMVMFDQYRSGQYRFLLFKNADYWRLETAVIWLNRETPLFRGGLWLALALAAGLAALRFEQGRAKAAVLALSSSGVVYTLTYLVFGVAAEYRYVYWTALSSLCAGIVVLAKWECDRRTVP